MVAAIVAGEPDGIAEAYDRYAASLYAYCHFLLPPPKAAEAVRNTFLIAVSRLDGLGDPDRLDAWLHAVARNECLRRLGPEDPEDPEGPEGPAGAASFPRSADPDELAAVTLPAKLRAQVLTACADNSPAGRAHRVSVTHRAGAFGPSGFPKAIGPVGPRWWQQVQRHHRPVAVVAVMAAVAAAAGITVIMTVGAANRPQASVLGFGAGVVGLSSTATPPPRPQRPPRPSGTPGRVSPASSPTRKAAPSASAPTPLVTPSVTMPADAPSPVPPSLTMTERPSASPSQTSSSASPSRPPSPSPSTSPAQGSLLTAPDKLLLTSAKGKAASGIFLLTATGGPVSEYTIKVPAAMAGKVTVSPLRGSLPAGGYVTVTVTVTSNVALNTSVTVEPGNHIVSVTLKIAD